MARDIAHSAVAVAWLGLLGVWVSANSIGVPSICDAYDDTIWKPLAEGGKAMYWATKPTRSTHFSVRSADGALQDDPKEYHPGELIYIHVRSLKEFEKPRGLMLYAKDSEGNKVGTWELPTDDKFPFHVP